MESMEWLGEGVDTGSLEECGTLLWTIISSEGGRRGPIGTSEFIASGCYQFKVRSATICIIRHFLTTLELLACGLSIRNMISQTRGTMLSESPPRIEGLLASRPTPKHVGQYQ